jgi:hypothetical protein
MTGTRRSSWSQALGKIEDELQRTDEQVDDFVGLRCGVP